MFEIGDTFSVKTKYYSAMEDGKLIPAMDKQIFLILDIKDNFFTVKLSYYYDFN